MAELSTGPGLSWPGALDGKVAIVTGSARGIGLQIARRMAEAGATVVLADLPTSALDDAAADVARFGRAARHVVDISDESTVRRLIDYTTETFGALDVLVNNAVLQGLPDDRDVVSQSVKTWDSIFAVNARGTMLMCKHAVAAMIEADGGSIVNIGSDTAVAGDDFATAYACTKAAIQTLTFYVATQYAHRGIRCNCIAPGLVNTAMLQATLPEPIRDAMIEGKLLRRLAEPDDVAQAVVFLASEHASFVTGQVLPIDGGLFAHAPYVAAVRKLVAG